MEQKSSGACNREYLMGWVFYFAMFPLASILKLKLKIKSEIELVLLTESVGSVI